jgi:hypothetical protein
MKASYHLRVLETHIKWSSAAKVYLVECLERLVVAQSGCCDVIHPSREVHAACLYMNTYHKTKIKCVQILKAEVGKFILRTLLQRKFKTIRKTVSGSVNSLSRRGKLPNRTIRPPALPITTESSMCNKVP